MGDIQKFIPGSGVLFIPALLYNELGVSKDSAGKLTVKNSSDS
jgi:hypothetical protein